MVLSFGFAVEKVQLHYVHYWNFLGDETDLS